MNDQNTPQVPQSTSFEGLLKRRQFFQVGGLTVLAGALAGCGSASGPASADAEQATDSSTLRVGMEAAYAPYNWQATQETEYTIPIENVSGAYADGYDVQIAKAVAEGLGMSPVAVKLSWDGLIGALQSGQIDVIIAGMSDTEERRESIDFSNPYIEDTIGIFVLEGSPYAECTNIQELSGASVMGQKGTLYDECIDEIEGVVHATPVDTMPGVLSQLAAGACDACTYGKMNEAGFMSTNSELVSLPLSEDGGFETTNPASVGIAKGQDEMLASINEVLSGISDADRQEYWDGACERQPA
ncbi:transporter substrate-binding domain-containing protein [Olsenella sp. YH-ols2217]|uniref:Transporter substrate-binding domain-containing protein n=1 Tax=Kribbibacterium absianum TaxID=3044210 RepID=A0ABT6ZKW9_9ACTN|nr:MULTISPECIES: transporter substrate-binding domain-containing protein [unclassified Olsenella]MDJ1122581.1 transporter substrate-binding domain-containing protein [Olsenella sp. YH-ols2216]MDJ1129459.1 transporter substrate-binding domain-containing protein [Olsenella sp. YH-ols2217]